MSSTTRRGRTPADVGRVLGMWVLGLVLLRGSTPLAVLLGMPELAVIGLGAGWGCITAGTSHILRRLFFPGLDLRQIMRIAVADGQSGWVVLGICLVLAALITLALFPIVLADGLAGAACAAGLAAGHRGRRFRARRADQRSGSPAPGRGA